MNARTILVLHRNSAPDSALSAVAQATRALGADVTLRPLDDRYDEILDDIARTDVCIYWRGENRA